MRFIKKKDIIYSCKSSRETNLIRYENFKEEEEATYKSKTSVERKRQCV